MFIDNAITRFSGGVNNVAVGDLLNSLPAMDPTRLHMFFEDFDYYVAANWTVTEVGTGSRALQDADGGRLLITNGAVDDNSNFFNKVGESFLVQTGKKLWFKAKMQISDATQSDLVCGLQITDTTPLDVTDGIFFLKADGAATLDFIAEKDNVQVSAAAVASLSDATDFTLGFFWDGISRIWYDVDGTTLGYIDPGTSLPDDEVLTVSFGVQNGEAVAKTLAVDYIMAAAER